MKIYTKRGDKGITSLASGKRVDKNYLNVECYGMIDELNSFIGLLRSHYADEHIKRDLLQIQYELFEIGATIADENFKTCDLPVLNKVKVLEQKIDEISEVLPPLKKFILPGGSIANSYAHIVRTVCRKTERIVNKLYMKNENYTQILMYLNRLSDYFFVLSRYISKKEGTAEILFER